jgi:hypothetical protein
MVLLQNLAVSGLLVIACVTFHFIGLRVIAVMIRVRLGQHIRDGQFFRRTFGLLAVVLSLVALHGVEIWAYAGAYMGIGALHGAETSIYFSAAAFSTLGADDVAMPAAWRLTGAIESVAGFLLIGLSTAFLVAVIDKLGMLESLARVGESGEPRSRDNVEP